MKNFGLGRVIEPAGSLPVTAWKLDNSEELRQGEIKIRLSSIVSITDALPGASVFFVYIRCTLVLVILASLLYAVFLAVLTVCKVGAAGVSAGTFRFSWHDAPPFAHEKTATGFLP